MRKDDHGKARWDLVPWRAMADVVDVLQVGANKYGDENWRLVPEYRRRYFSAAMRHLISWWWAKESVDPESGKSHLAHAVCCLLFLLDLSIPPGSKIDTGGSYE